MSAMSDCSPNRIFHIFADYDVDGFSVRYVGLFSEPLESLDKPVCPISFSVRYVGLFSEP